MNNEYDNLFKYDDSKPFPQDVVVTYCIDPETKERREIKHNFPTLDHLNYFIDMIKKYSIYFPYQELKVMEDELHGNYQYFKIDDDRKIYYNLTGKVV
jgi:hypothetical protein